MHLLRLGKNSVRFLAFWAIPSFHVYHMRRVTNGAPDYPPWLFLLSSCLAGALLVWLSRLKGQSYASVKSLWERPFSALLLLVSFPLLLFASLLIKWDSPGPALYCQKRVGMNGRQKERRRSGAANEAPPCKERRQADRRHQDLGGHPFIIYKLRSMRADAEQTTGAAWSTGDHDPRVTKIGYYIRKIHLDELPQLYNVLRGEMSLIGPRPERPDFILQLAQMVDGYRKRLIVQPGITGLSQIRREADQSLEDVEDKLRNDLEYIENICLFLDAKIALKTVLLVANLFWNAVRKRTIGTIEPKTPDILFAKDSRTDR